MRIERFLILLAVSSACWGQTQAPPRSKAAPCKTWSMTIRSELGYRRDRQEFSEPSFTTQLSDCNSLLFSGELVWAWEHVVLKFNGSYGWILNGLVEQANFLPPFRPTATPFSPFHLASGYTLDLQPFLGCKILFWKICPHAITFIPALGFNYSHNNFFPEGQKRAPLAGTSGFSLLTYTKPMQQDWFGPIAEGRISYTYRNLWRCDLYYQYTHVDFRQTYEQTLSNYLTAGGVLTTAETARVRVASKGNTLRTQLGGLDLSYRSPAHWQLGGRFEGSATWSQTAKSFLYTTQDSFTLGSTQTKSSTREKLSVHWTKYLVSFYAGYWF